MKRKELAKYDMERVDIAIMHPDGVMRIYYDVVYEEGGDEFHISCQRLPFFHGAVRWIRFAPKRGRILRAILFCRNMLMGDGWWNAPKSST